MKFIIYILWSIVEKGYISNDQQAFIQILQCILGHLDGNLKKLQEQLSSDHSGGADHGKPSHILNISFEKEIGLWSVVTFKRSVLELDKVQARCR